MMRGVTYVEAILALALLSLVSSIVLALVGGANANAADAERATRLHALQDAVDAYAIAHGHVPNSNGAWASLDSLTYQQTDIIEPEAPDLATALAPYLERFTDPRTAMLGTDAGYLYTSNGVDYCILLYRVPHDMRNFSADLVPPRCGEVDARGRCTSGANALYLGTGTYAGGC